MSAAMRTLSDGFAHSDDGICFYSTCKSCGLRKVYSLKGAALNNFTEVEKDEREHVCETEAP